MKEQNNEKINNLLEKTFEDIEQIKETIKEENIQEYNTILPIINKIKELLIYTIISYNENINDNEVKKTLENVQEQTTISQNLNDISILINYIQKNIEPNFLDILTKLHVSKKKGYPEMRKFEEYNMPISHYKNNSFVSVDEYKNAYIEIKNLLTTSNEYEKIDLNIFIHYLESLKEICLYLMLKKQYINLINNTDTFYNNKTFNEMLTSRLSYTTYDDLIQCADGIDLLDFLDFSFAEYFEQLYIYCDEVKQYISPLGGQTPSEVSSFIKEDFNKIFGELNINDIKNSSSNQRYNTSHEIEDKKESLLDQHFEMDEIVREWKDKIRHIYLSDYQSDNNRQFRK